MQNDPFGVKEGQEIMFSSVLVFLIDLSLKRKSDFFKKLLLLARRSAEERNKIASIFGGERNKIARSLRRKGMRLLVDSGGRE